MKTQKELYKILKERIAKCIDESNYNLVLFCEKEALINEIQGLFEEYEKEIKKIKKW